jgi:hydrogenase-4 component B
MIKTGIYGLLLTLTFLGPPPEWWGWLLVGIGLTSGCLGVLFALAQHDIKRLLAYHSVENIGIIALGMGVGLLGLSSGSGLLAALGFAGALLHVVNHAVFKGLLFLGAGAIGHSTGTRELDHLGGLLKRMPWTGFTFIVGAVAISGLPPLNGFISEFLIYLGSFQNGVRAPLGQAIPSLAVIAGLALIGGLAAACFTKACGIVFLGEPRGHRSAQAHEVGIGMKMPMIVLAAACLAIGLLSPMLVAWMAPVVHSVTGLPSDALSQSLGAAIRPLRMIVLASCLFFVVLGLLTLARRLALGRRPVSSAGTWDCGYARPSVRMQYTASSFVQPLTDLFRPFLQTRRKTLSIKDVFPSRASLATHTPDVFHEGIFNPLFAAIVKTLGRLKAIQHGRVHIYVLYVVITILVLLIWKL